MILYLLVCLGVFFERAAAASKNGAGPSSSRLYGLWWSIMWPLILLTHVLLHILLSKDVSVPADYKPKVKK